MFVDETLFFSSDALKGICFVDNGRLFLHTSPIIPFAKASFHVLSCSRAWARGRLSGLKGRFSKLLMLIFALGGQGRESACLGEGATSETSQTGQSLCCR